MHSGSTLEVEGPTLVGGCSSRLKNEMRRQLSSAALRRARLRAGAGTGTGTGAGARGRGRGKGQGQHALARTKALFPVVEIFF